MTDLEWAALVAIGTIAFLDRWPVLQAMLSRPIVVGTGVGLALGDPAGGALWGAVIEAMYLGQLPVGASRLPDAGLAALTGTTTALLGAAEGAYPAVLAGVLAWGAGHAGTLVDGAQRRWNGVLAARARDRSRAGDPGAPGRALAWALVSGALLGAAASGVAVGVAAVAVDAIGASPWSGPLEADHLRLLAAAALVVTGTRAFVRARPSVVLWGGGAVVAGLLAWGIA